jgi:CRP-like cAMP-binding protein
VPAADPSELASVQLFESLAESELAEVAAWFEVREVGPGVRLIGEGTTGYSFFVIGEGEVVVTAHGEPIASLGPGEFFGEMALLGPGRGGGGGGKNTHTTTPARLLVLFGNDFVRLTGSYPRIGAGIEAVMQKRLGPR